MDVISFENRDSKTITEGELAVYNAICDFHDLRKRMPGFGDVFGRMESITVDQLLEAILRLRQVGLLKVSGKMGAAATIRILAIRRELEPYVKVEVPEHRKQVA